MEYNVCAMLIMLHINILVLIQVAQVILYKISIFNILKKNIYLIIIIN